MREELWFRFLRNHFPFSPFPITKAKTDEPPISSLCEAVLFLVDPQKLPGTWLDTETPDLHFHNAYTSGGLLMVYQSRVVVQQDWKRTHANVSFLYDKLWMTNTEMDLKFHFYSDL